jgi:hypothetical protein
MKVLAVMTDSANRHQQRKSIFRIIEQSKPYVDGIPCPSLIEARNITGLVALNGIKTLFS